MDSGGARLRAARLARGLSQQELAQRSGVSPRTMRAIESGSVGRPHQASLRRIADGLGLSATQRDRFVRSWHPAPSASMTQIVGEPLDVDTFLGARGEYLNAGTQVISAVDHLTVRGLRPDFGHQTMMIEAERDNITGRWLLWGHEPGQDLDKVRAAAVLGGTVTRELTLPGIDVKAIWIQFPAPLRSGDVHYLDVRWDFSRSYTGPVPQEQEYVLGWRSVPHHAVVAVTFVDHPPHRLWRVEGPDPARLRATSPVTLYNGGTAACTFRAEKAGMGGIRWVTPTR